MTGHDSRSAKDTRSRKAQAPGCPHPRLRATEYDESYRWLVTCKDCGWSGSMTQAEWRRRLLSHGLGTSRVPLLVETTPAAGDSGRVDLR
jgi:hypothetical protein